MRLSLMDRVSCKGTVGCRCTYEEDKSNVYVIGHISKKYAYIRKEGTSSEIKTKKDKVTVLDFDKKEVISKPKKWVEDLRKEYRYLIPAVLSKIGNVDEWDIEEDDEGDVLHYSVDGVRQSKQIKILANDLI